MEKEQLFKWKHFQPEIILLTVRWYLRYNLSFRNLVEMMGERGLLMAHTTIMRWVHQYGNLIMFLSLVSSQSIRIRLILLQLNS